MKKSLKRKTIFLFAAIGLLIGAISILVYAKGVSDITKTLYSQQSIDLTKTVAAEIEVERVERLQKAVKEIYDNAPNVVLSDKWGSPEFNEYIALYKDIEKSEDFIYLRDHLRKIQDVNNVDCLYITWLDVETERVVYLVDAAYEDACPPGCVDPLFGEQSETLKNPNLGLAPNITNTPEYGWIIATGMPIVDKQGNYIAYAAADISMNGIMLKGSQFLLVVAGILVIMTVLVCIIGFVAVDRSIVRPINKLSNVAKNYTTSTAGEFAQLDINRTDEIGILADSMVRMEHDIDGYIANLTRTRDELVEAQVQAEKMYEAANIDALTSVRNKRAYDLEVIKLNKTKEPYGLIMIDLNELKTINDGFGHEKGDDSIKKLCEVVCRIFKHSPVFRVGGDEFVVVLKNDDFKDRQALIEKLKASLDTADGSENLNTWEKVSAAVGFAVYDPEKDRNAEDVFNRADKAMYEEKDRMKNAQHRAEQ